MICSTIAKAASTHKLGELKLLCPCTPSKILAVGLNYKSHLGEPPGARES